MRILFLLLMMLITSDSYTVLSLFKSKPKPILIVEYAEKGDLDGVKKCVAKGIDINTINQSNYTSLMIAFRKGELEIAKWLIENGASANIIDYARIGDLERVNNSISGDVYINERDSSNNTALIYASHGGHLEIVELLVENGANVNTRSGQDMVALWSASYNGHLDIVKFLVENGADINAKDLDGETALSMATRQGHKDVVKYLKSKRAN